MAARVARQLIATNAEVAWRPDPDETGPTEQAEAVDEGTAALRERLRQTGVTSNELLSEVLLYHRREAKPAYWRYFKRIEMSEEELLDEDDEAIAGLEINGPEDRIKKSRLVPMRFPGQQFKLRPGSAVDPVSERTVGIILVDSEKSELSLKLGEQWKGETPRALIPGKPLPTNEQRAALRRLAEAVLEKDGRYPACKALLRRELPTDRRGGPRPSAS